MYSKVLNPYLLTLLTILLGVLHIYISINGANSILSVGYVLICCAIIYGISITNYHIFANAATYFYYIKWLLYVVISTALIIVLTNLITANPLQYKEADMLPVIQVMGDRFIHGQPVYSTILEIWGGMQPVYLPAMWLPYTIPQLLHADVRWMSVMAIVGSFLFVFMSTTSTRQLICGVCFYLYCLYYCSSVYPGYVLYSEEPITLLYVSFLFYSIYHKSWQTILLAFALCMLSRYWVVVALPFVVFQYFKTNKNHIYNVWPTVLLLVFVVCITPLHQYQVWLGLPSLYAHALADAGNYFKYNTVINKYGLVKVLPNQVRPYSTVIGVIVTILALLCVTYYKRRSHNYVFIIFASTIVLMLSFIVLPYEYLMFTIPFTIYLLVHYNVSYAHKPYIH